MRPDVDVDVLVGLDFVMPVLDGCVDVCIGMCICMCLMVCFFSACVSVTSTR